MDDTSVFQVEYQDPRHSDGLPCSIDIATCAFPPQDQFEIFRATYQGVMDVDLTRSEDFSFPARQMVWDLGKLVFTRTKLPGKGYGHRWRHMRKATLDHWYVTSPFHGSEPGDWHLQRASLPSLHCLAKPFEAEREDDGILTLFMPRDLFASTSAFDHMLDVQLDGGLGLLLADYLFLLNRSLQEIKAEELPNLVEATRSLIAACMAPSRDRLADAQQPIDSILMERARRLIDRKLADADLTPNLLCTELGASRSRLYRLFKPVGGISAYIRRRRLLRTRDALTDSTDTRSIVRIAEQWGFVDASAYSRAFRSEFGLSPKEAREASWRSNGYFPAEDKPRSPIQMQSLTSILHSVSA